MIDEPTASEQAMVPFEGGPGAPREIALTPREVLNAAKEQAEVLMELVGQKHLSTRMGQSEHLHAEAWITIAAFNNIVAKTKWVKPEHDENGKVSGYEAEVELLHTPTGEIRGGAIMSCGLDAFPCQSKRGSEKDKAAKSAAQTWAAAKAIRMTLSYVPVLAGYSPVPYEEMQASVAQPDERTESTPFCEKHGVSFIHQRAKDDSNRTWYSHPADDEPRGWCNYTQPAEAPDKGGRYWGKEAMEKLGLSLKAERPETFMADLKKIVGDNTGGVALRAFATSKDLKTAAALLKFILEEWHIDDDDKAQDSLPQGGLAREAVEAGERAADDAAATEGDAAHEEGDEEQVTDENLPW